MSFNSPEAEEPWHLWEVRGALSYPLHSTRAARTLGGLYWLDAVSYSGGQTPRTSARNDSIRRDADGAAWLKQSAHLVYAAGGGAVQLPRLPLFCRAVEVATGVGLCHHGAALLPSRTASVAAVCSRVDCSKKSCSCGAPPQGLTVMCVRCMAVWCPGDVQRGRIGMSDVAGVFSADCVA